MLRRSPRDAGRAWVVSWRDSSGVQGSRAEHSEAEAGGVARSLRMRGYDVAVALLPDLTPDEAVDALIMKLGGEVRPGVLEGLLFDELPYRILFERRDLARLAYQAEEIADDRDPHEIPQALHPRRLGVTWFLDDLEERVASLMDDEDPVFDIRGGRDLWSDRRPTQ